MTFGFHAPEHAVRGSENRHDVERIRLDGRSELNRGRWNHGHW
jgi:hypothetical protein